VNRLSYRESTNRELKKTHAGADALQVECLEFVFELRREAQIGKISPQLAGIG